MENEHFIIIRGETDACFHEIEKRYKGKNTAIYSVASISWMDKKVRELFVAGEEKMKQHLTTVGLAEYSYFSRNVSDLSATEKIRLFIAQCLEEKVDVIVIDENSFSEEKEEAIIGCFLNARKVGRLKGICIVVVFSTSENEKYMLPDKIIEVLPEGITIIKNQRTNGDKAGMFMNEMDFRSGTIEDYKTLEQYHYIKLPETEIDFIRCASYKGIIAAIVIYISPIREIGMENIKKNSIFQYMLKHVMCCSRIVANPYFRGLGVTKKLIQYGIETVPCKVMECRSSMLNHTKVLERWGGVEVKRSYRNYVPCYDALCEFLSEWNIHLDRDYDKKFILNLSDEEKVQLRKLILFRLKEIDQNQWRYYEQLVRMSTNFFEEEYKLAAESYIELYQKQYQSMSISELLDMCRNWNSAAYILKLKKGEQCDE